MTLKPKLNVGLPPLVWGEAIVPETKVLTTGITPTSVGRRSMRPHPTAIT